MSDDRHGADSSEGALPEGLDDQELTALALAADPETVVDEDATNFWDLAGPGEVDLLPEWYMPSPMGGLRPLRGWRRRVALLIVFALLAIVSAGLCSTYGHVVVA